MGDALLSRAELEQLTGTIQPKRMCAWLSSRGWVFEPPASRGKPPAVARAYFDARMTGRPLSSPSHERVGPRLDFFAEA